MSYLRALPRPIALAVVGLLVIGAFFVLRSGSDTRNVSADFSRAVAVFPGSEVRILGVPVGNVTAVIPEGNSVRVEMEYDAKYKVPADAQAVIITPTLTADRFVQLTPAYTKGPEIKDGDEIAVEDTGTPIELDRIYRSLSDLTVALGPNGVNKDGTLDNVLGAGAKFLDGQGKKANSTIVDLSRAVKVFGDGSGDLFATVRALDEFSGALAANDKLVSRFMENLGGVSQQLAGEKEELSAALANLSGVLGKVERFVRDNRELLVSDVDDLTRVVKVLGEEKAALTTILDVAPSAMGNLAVAFDPKSGSIGSRITGTQNIQDLDGLLCTLARQDQIPNADTACKIFSALLEPITGSLPIAQKGSGAADGSTKQVEYGSGASATDLGSLLGGGA